MCGRRSVEVGRLGVSFWIDHELGQLTGWELDPALLEDGHLGGSRLGEGAARGSGAGDDGGDQGVEGVGAGGERARSGGATSRARRVMRASMIAARWAWQGSVFFL